MKKTLLSCAALLAATVAMQAQTTYNYFDPADVDADGWIWFNTQEKLDKYCGFGSQFKIQFLETDYELEDFSKGEPYSDPELPGYDTEGVEGGEGSWTGAIELYGASKSSGADVANGAGIKLNLPDVSEISIAISAETSPLQLGLKAGDAKASGDYAEEVDCANIQTYYRIGIFGTKLTDLNQYTWNNLQNVVNKATEAKIKTAPSTKQTVIIRNNRGCPMLIHGMKVLTYTNTNNQGAVSDIADDVNLVIACNGESVEAQGANISVTNLAGMEIASGANAVSTASLAPGVYIVKAEAANQSAVRKIVKK